MEKDVHYYYRGTTPGWPGNPVLQSLGMTCATADPLVATLFAVECRSYGPGIILVVPREPFAGRLGPSNHFALLECAVNIMVPPVEFARHAVVSLDVDRSLYFLADLGFDQLPTRINGPNALRTALLQSQAASERLSVEQIRLFNRRLFEGGP